MICNMLKKLLVHAETVPQLIHANRLTFVHANGWVCGWVAAAARGGAPRSARASADNKVLITQAGRVSASARQSRAGR